jgi:NADH-quinone oxidoreductase subunit G
VRTDLYVLSALADQMDVHLGLPDAAAARAELAALGTWRGDRVEPPVDQGWEEGLTPRMVGVSPPGTSSVRLATWHQLLDSGRMQDGEPNLAGTARPAVARMSAATAAQAGTADGDKVTVATGQGSVTVPVEVVPMADHVVWLPAAGLPRGPQADTAPAGAPYPGGAEPAVRGGTTIRAELGAGHGATVTLRRPE